MEEYKVYFNGKLLKVFDDLVDAQRFMMEYVLECDGYYSMNISDSEIVMYYNNYVEDSVVIKA